MATDGGITVEVDDTAFRRALRKVEGGVDDLTAENTDGAKIVADEARTLVPVRSGRLKSSIRSSGQARQGAILVGSATVPYAGPIHFGWRAHNIAPQPFLYDAADARRDEVLERFHDGVDTLARKAGLDVHRTT